jgi:hypothetical protein
VVFELLINLSPVLVFYRYPLPCFSTPFTAPSIASHFRTNDRAFMARGFFQSAAVVAIRTFPHFRAGASAFHSNGCAPPAGKAVGRPSDLPQRARMTPERCQTGGMQNFKLSASCRAAALCLLLPALGAAHAQGDGATSLLNKHSALAESLANNPFGRPLVLESTEANNRVTGHAYAVLDFPFNTVSAQFKNPNQWCEVMILHLNTKYCRASGCQRPTPR